MGKGITPGFVLGIWDGHDAGAALIRGDQPVFAINEERLTRRKLEVGFPRHAIRACLDFAGIAPEKVKDVAASTTDPAKTLTRLFPSLKEEYYLIRRRKKDPKRLDALKKRFKYRFTELPPNPISHGISRFHLHHRLKRSGFRHFRLHLLDHHLCHAWAAAGCSGLKKCLVVTMDGVGDGLCGSIWRFENHHLMPVQMMPSTVSVGIFFEHVTNLMNMRELEDEGKVMALANYAYPIDDRDNPLMDLVTVKGLELITKYRSNRMFQEMKKILWRYPSEQFAYMAQRVLEKRVMEVIQNAMAETGLCDLALAGGLFSNIKLNMKLAELSPVGQMAVFPHMGDGGLGVGAALAANFKSYGIPRCELSHLYLGSGYTREEIARELNRHPVSFSEVGDVARTAARKILDGEIILWFQGRSEIGPRALGNRSILARADDLGVKDRLNLALKKRVWYQPFCPSLLSEDAKTLLHKNGQNPHDNRFMTSAFRVRKERKGTMAGVMNIDGTCRPQFVGDENPLYRDLLQHIKEATGSGVVLNTSFNVHGDPIVNSPGDAVDTLIKTGARYLFIGNFLVENPTALDHLPNSCS